MRLLLLGCLFCLVDSAVNSPIDDLKRARTKVPQQSYRGIGPEKTALALNKHLHKLFDNVKPCADWTVTELQELQLELLSHRQEEFQAIYRTTADPRALRHSSEELQRRWARLNAMAVQADPITAHAHRDGHCYETVMWLVHHLSREDQRKVVGATRAVPALPTQRSSCQEDVHAELCSAIVDQHTCMYCHSTDEGSGKGKDIPVPDPRPGHTDTFPVYAKRFIANTSGWTYMNQNGTNQSGKISNETYTMTYYYDYPNNRMRQDTTYNSTSPQRSGITWFNGSTKTWYIIQDYHVGPFKIPMCIKMPPPIKTIQRPDWVLAANAQMPGNGSYVGREDHEQGEGGEADHWRGTFYRSNPYGMLSNASFDIWLDPKTAHIKKLIGRCDPPDAKEGSPTMAVANYDSFQEVSSADSMDEFFDKDEKLIKGIRWCIPITPHVAQRVLTFHGPGLPSYVAPLESLKEVQDVLPRLVAEYERQSYLV